MTVPILSLYVSRWMYCICCGMWCRCRRTYNNRYVQLYGGNVQQRTVYLVYIRTVRYSCGCVESPGPSVKTTATVRGVFCLFVFWSLVVIVSLILAVRLSVCLARFYGCWEDIEYNSKKPIDIIVTLPSFTLPHDGFFLELLLLLLLLFLPLSCELRFDFQTDFPTNNTPIPFVGSYLANDILSHRSAFFPLILRTFTTNLYWKYY